MYRLITACPLLVWRFRSRLPMLLLAALTTFPCIAMQAPGPVATHATGPASPSPGAPRSFVVSKTFASGGSVSLDTNDADVRIVRDVEEGQIRLEVGVESDHLTPEQAEQRWLRHMLVEGNQATIELQLPKDRSAGSVTLYVPSITSLVVKQRSGRLTVNGVKGDKNLSIGTGTLTLREADPSSYQHIRADVSVGQLTNGVFHGKESGLLGRKLSVDGKGSYQLQLHVGDGEIVLTEEDGGL